MKLKRIFKNIFKLNLTLLHPTRILKDEWNEFYRIGYCELTCPIKNTKFYRTNVFWQNSESSGHFFLVFLLSVLSWAPIASERETALFCFDCISYCVIRSLFVLFKTTTTKNFESEIEDWFTLLNQQKMFNQSNFS